MEQRTSTHSTNRTQRHRLTGVASAYIEPYLTQKNGLKRWRVRARAGRSGAPLMHLGSFEKRSHALTRLKWAEDLLAAGIVPSLDRLFPGEASPTLTVTQAVDQYLRQRRNFADRTRATYTSLRPHIDRSLGDKDAFAVTPNDVRELIDACVSAPLGPDATRSVRGILAGALRHAGVKPNPAHDETITLPSRKSTRMDVPPAEHVEAILLALPDELFLPVALLEATGARVSELCAVTYGDVDHANGRLRLVGKGDKPRLVPLPHELGALMPRVSASQRATAGKVWPGLTADRLRKQMLKASDSAGVPRYTPHKLRHRYASRLVQQGVPINQISPLLGHAKTSMTLDVYASVLRDGDTAEAWRAVIH